MSFKRTRTLVLAAVFALPAMPVFANDASPAGMEMTHRMMLLAIQFGLILFAAKLGNILFEKIRLPGALGELAAGIVLGPYALGGLAFYGFPHGLFPLHDGGIPLSPELYGLASIAAIVLLFDVGLETDLKLLLRYSLAGGLVGAGGLVASFFFGAGVVMVFSPMVFNEQLGLFAPPCLLLGTITTATSVGITARILSERRRLDSPEGVTVLSAAVIDDVLGIVLLAVVMSLLTAGKAGGGVDWGRIGIIAAKAVGVWLAATILGLLAARKISFLLKWFGERTTIGVMSLGLALILAGLFEEAGLAMIIGAYVMGLSLSQSDIAHVVREKLHPIHSLLVPVFFCTTGMMINITALGSQEVLLFGLVYAFAAMAAKVLGCGLPAMLANFNLRGAARIGFGMSPRCEVALIIAGVGLSAGLLDSRILAAVIIMVLVNTVVAPPVLSVLLRSDKRGTRKPVPEDKAEVLIPIELPSIPMAVFFTSNLTEVFEEEGFFSHLIRRNPPLYQLRKDRSVIDLSRSNETLTFACRQEDRPLVNGVIFEAAASVEKAIKGLTEPLDSGALQARMQDDQATIPREFKIEDYLRTDLINPNLMGNTKAEIIDELLNMLAERGLVADVEDASAAVWQREESMSTGLQYGVAIPHGKTDKVSRLVCAVGVKAGGVEFDALDKKPSKIFILTLSPKSKPAPHVQFMSTVSQVLNQAGRADILRAESASQIYRVFTRPIQEPSAEPEAPAEQPPAQRIPRRFRLRDYIEPRLIQQNLWGNSKKQIILELLDLMAKAGLVRNVREASKVVLDRESQLSTGMEEGLAVPHGRTDEVDRMVCAVGIKPGGFDWGSVDGKASQIFVLVLTPTQGADPYLQFVASMMAALDEQGRQKALAARTPEQVCQVLCEQDELDPRRSRGQ